MNSPSSVAAAVPTATSPVATAAPTRVVRVPPEVPAPEPGPTAASAAAPAAAAAAEGGARPHVGQPSGNLLRGLGQELGEAAGQGGVLVGEEGRGEPLLAGAARAPDAVDLFFFFGFFWKKRGKKRKEK